MSVRAECQSTHHISRIMPTFRNVNTHSRCEAGTRTRTTAACGLNARLWRDERQQYHVPRALNRGGETTLVLGACASAAARQNLATLRHKTLKTLHVFVIRRTNALGAEGAHLAPSDKPASPISPI